MATNRQNLTSKPALSVAPAGPLLVGAAAGISDKVSPAVLADLTPVRRSTRDIKRKKFDDELIDSAVLSKTAKKQRNSISETKQGGGSSLTEPKSDADMSPVVTTVSVATQPENINAALDISFLGSKAEVPNVGVDAVMSPSSLVPATPSVTLPEIQQQTTKKKGKGSKKSAASTAVQTNEQLQEQAAALKDVGRWQATDDLALITAVMQISDLKAVYTGVKFTCKFTLQEIAERWYALLYDPMISKLAQEAMKQVPPEIALAIQSGTLFGKSEERLLSTILSNITPSMELFNDLLVKHPDVFHPARTARSLYQHWLHMRQYRLLPDQKAPPLPQGDYVMNFSDLEDNFNESDVPPMDPLIERDLMLTERHLTKQIRQLETELPKWHVLVECATGVVTPDFDGNTVAVLRGRLVRYLMRSKEVTVGRSAAGYQVDIDLSLEGPAFKISRKQATIKLRPTGEFFMVNEGKRPMYIDGKPLVPGSKAKLNSNSIIEIACLRLLFLVNHELISNMRTESIKQTT